MLIKATGMEEQNGKELSSQLSQNLQRAKDCKSDTCPQIATQAGLKPTEDWVGEGVPQTNNTTTKY